MSDLDYTVGWDGREFDRGADQTTRRSRRFRNDVRGDFASVQNGAIGMARSIGAMGKQFVTGIGAGVATLGAFVAVAKDAADRVNDIARQAETAGLSFEAFQELKYVAEENLIGVDALTDGLKELQLRADEFVQTGKGSAAESFQRLGFSAKELAEGLKEPDRLFEQIIEKMKRLDRPAQIRVADELFGGTAGEQFVRLLDQAEGSIARTRDRARELGLVMSDDLAKKAGELDRLFNQVSQTVGVTLKSAIVSAAYSLAQFIDGFRAFENQRTSTLEQELTDLGRDRVEIENEILRIREQQANNQSFLAQAENRQLDASIAAKQEQLGKLSEQEAEIIRILNNRPEEFTPDDTTWTPPPTDPSGGKSRKAAISEIERHRKAVADLTAELAFEEAQLRRTAVEQEVYNRLKSAGIDINSEDGQRLAERIRLIEQEKQAIDAARQAEEARLQSMEYLFGLGGQGLEALISKSGDAEEAIKRLAIQLALAVAQAALLGSGPLAGGFGGGSLFGGFGGGGVVDPWAGLRATVLHTGGIAGAGGASRTVDATVFQSAIRYHDGGIAGLKPGEVPAILRAGEPVDPGDGSVFGKMFGGGRLVVVLRLSGDLDARIDERAGNVADVRIERYDEGGVERTAVNLREAQSRSLL